MTRRLRRLAATAALGVAASASLTVGCNRTPPAPAADEPPVAVVPVLPSDDSAKGVEISQGIALPGDGKLVTAVAPKPLSDAVKKGVTFLAETQQADGGWNQGGGWRTSDKGSNGRVEGKEVADPSDVGNTAFALLAFLRAGHSAAAGDYKDVVGNGLAFLCKKVSAADADSLYVTDVRDTQLQKKIGNYVDTFMTTLVLTEFKGQAGDHEKAVATARDKSLDKIAKNQTEKGEYAGNTGWASNLSWGIANKALSRAKMSGAKVPEQVIVRATKRLESQAAAVPEWKMGGETATPGSGFGGGGGGFGGGSPGVGPSSIGGTDAGVGLYGLSQNSTNLRDFRNAAQSNLGKARMTLADADAPKDAKERAASIVTETEKVDKLATAGEMQLGKRIRDKDFVAGFGSNGGEEFLSFLNISEALLVKAGEDWDVWNGKMQDAIPKAQDKDGSWSGKHCITGKTFCTSAALLVLLADRTPFPADVLADARAVKADVKAEVKESK